MMLTPSFWGLALQSHIPLTVRSPPCADALPDHEPRTTNLHFGTHEPERLSFSDYEARLAIQRGFTPLRTKPLRRGTRFGEVSPKNKQGLRLCSRGAPRGRTGQIIQPLFRIGKKNDGMCVL